MKQQTHNLLDIAESSQFQMTSGNDDLGFTFKLLGRGKTAGVQAVTLHCGTKKMTVIPTRGMGIWQAEHDNIRFGWDSPVKGPVHPMWVPVSEPSGIGWLDGFDEMMVRCGLASNGAPEFDDQGKLIWPLHGRVANLPATDLSVDMDESTKRIAIRGTVDEDRFHLQRLRLQTEISMQAESDEISITDTVTNLSDRPSSFQMLYHNNFGSPLLESGSQFFAPIKKLVPRNEHAAAGLSQWNHYGPPDAGFAEQVYFMELSAGEDNHSTVLLTNANQSKGVSIRYDVTTLPCFSLWKNTVGLADGYVTGLEPATNFPNPRSFEEEHDRVVELAPGQSQTMSFQIGMLTNADSVAAAIRKVESLSNANPEIVSAPPSNWCAP